MIYKSGAQVCIKVDKHWEDRLGEHIKAIKMEPELKKVSFRAAIGRLNKGGDSDMEWT
jgi:hypothetical protein